jgi:CubicO group peptidase (beta-lactamase class C family)
MREGYQDISIEALLRHESGVQADTLIGDGTALTVQDILAMVKPNSTPHEIRMRYAVHLLNRPPAATPNRKHVYSNGGYALAATMAENATGMAFDQLLKQYVFDAANLSSAKASLAGAPGMPGTPGQTWGHQRQNGKFNTLVTSWQPGQRIFAPAGAGIAMNLDDLAKFGNYHLRGLRGEIKELSQATFERLHYLPLIPIHTYACGWVIQDRTGETSHWHNGSDGSYYAVLATFPESDVVIAAAANCGLIPNTPSVVDQVVWSMAHAIRQRKKDMVKS